MAELKWLSQLLAVAVVIFIVMSSTLLIVPSFPATTPSFDSLIYPDKQWTTFSSFCTISVAFFYQINTFPVFDALKEQTTEEFSKAQTRGLLFSILVYFMISFLGIYLFGPNLESSVLLNFGQPAYFNPNTGKPYWESTVIQFAFMIVLLCHIPYLFYIGKESLCCLFDELHRRSISSVLKAKHPELVDEIEPAINEENNVSIVETNRLAYKDMDTAYYLLCTFSLYFLELFLATTVGDISIIFAFISAFTISALAFWFPGYYYLLSV